MRRRGYLWCSARTERASNCRDVRTCKSAVEKRNCKCMGRTMERKLKFVCEIAKIDRGSLCDFAVAPHAGAWVEIESQTVNTQTSAVAPHAGAWVEIWWSPASMRAAGPSPPTRGRGLKFHVCIPVPDAPASPPTRGRGLKSGQISPRTLTSTSPPTRGRGLK